LDEPLSNLEPGFRQEMRRELHLLQRRLRATMVYVTHDQVEAMNLGDRVAVLNAGRIQQVDQPGVLYDRPCNRFVAGFIGWPPMNFLDGQVIRNQQGRFHFRVEEWTWSLPPKTQQRLLGSLTGEWVTAGIRPEHVKLTAPGQEAVASGGPIMAVVLIEPLGATQLVTVGRGRWRLLALVDRREWLAEQRTVAVDIDMDRTCWFDRLAGWALGSGDPAG
jgi:multiple sugar transport system ATP-binding protein